MIKNFFKIQIKYISHERASRGPENNPNEMLAKELANYDTLIKLLEQKGTPISSNLLTVLELSMYLPLLSEYNTNTEVRERLNDIVEETFLNIGFRKIIIYNNINRLLMEKIGNSSTTEQTTEINQSRFVLIINYFLDMIKQKPTKTK
jgi:hypothetical protein